MRRLVGFAAALALVACSTPAPAPPEAADAGGISDKPLLVGVPLGPSAPSCPEKTEVLFRPTLPEPGFVPAPPPGAVLVKPQRLSGAEPGYPAASKRCREQGTVTITYCVDANGKAENVQVVTSSGYARLDNAMLAWASRDRHVAGTVNGKPARYCGLHTEESFEPQMPTATASPT